MFSGDQKETGGIKWYIVYNIIVLNVVDVVLLFLSRVYTDLYINR